MQVKYLGFFSQYHESSDPETTRLMGLGAIFMKNSEGKDWYEFVLEQKPNGCVYLLVDSTGCVVSCEEDPSRLCPLDFNVWMVPKENVPANLINMNTPVLYTMFDGWVFEDRRYSVRVFEQTKARKMSKLSSRIQDILEAIEDGDATSEEISELNSLKQCRSVLRRATCEMVESNGWPE